MAVLLLKFFRCKDMISSNAQLHLSPTDKKLTAKKTAEKTRTVKKEPSAQACVVPCDLENEGSVNINKIIKSRHLELAI